MYNIIQKRNIWLSLSSIMVLLSIVALFIWKLNLGIDFTGGALLEVEFKGDRPSIDEVQNSLSDLDLGSLILQPVNDQGLIIRFQDISEEKHQDIIGRLEALTEMNEDEEEKMNEGEIEVVTDGDATTSIDINIDEEMDNTSSAMSSIDELRYDAVGPSIGEELKRKSVTAIIIVLIAIVAFIAWAFRKVSKPIASWKYGISAIIALFHDVIITLGIFSVLGYIYNIEVNTAFVAAILTVLGYSVNDTIVVFDRVRENLPQSEDDFEGTVNTSVNQTIKRSINTSLTTLFVLLAILFFGGSTIKDFVLALSIGIAIGTYSSIFLASPLLVVWEKRKL